MIVWYKGADKRKVYMKFTFSNSESCKRFLVSIVDLPFFKKIKENNIQLDLELNGKISKDVLGNKKIDDICPDITKLGDLKEILEKRKDKNIEIKKITLELE